jgi:hypothetical protein
MLFFLVYTSCNHLLSYNTTVTPQYEHGASIQDKEERKSHFFVLLFVGTHYVERNVMLRELRGIFMKKKIMYKYIYV